MINHAELQRSHWPLIVAIVLLAVPLRLQEELLFHTVAETVSIVLAGAAFRAAWRAYPYSRNDFLMFVAIVLFWSGALDLVHMLLYKGLTPLDIGDADPATQLWIGTRYLQAAGMLAAPCFLVRSLNRWNAFSVFAGVAGALLVVVLAGLFPLAYVTGPTPRTAFKVTSEYLVATMFALAFVFLWLRRSRLERPVLVLALCALAVLTAAELAFTLYIDINRVSNVVGHLLKVAAYWLLYRAILGAKSAFARPD